MSITTGHGEPDGGLPHDSLQEELVSEANGHACVRSFEGGDNQVNGSGNIGVDFDTVIGHMEDMLIDDEFHDLQSTFLEKYWEIFVEGEENKHEYMTVFMEYTNEIEAFIQKYIQKLIPHFDMEKFITELERRRDNLDGEIFEVLFTLTDFNVFKEMFLDYRLMKQGDSIDVGQSLYVSPIK